MKNKKNGRIFSLLTMTAVLMISALLFTACPDPVVVYSADSDITLFTLTAEANSVLSEDASVTIDGTDITLTVPYGTDVSALIASFTISGISVSVGSVAQVSGTTANDFTNPVTYVVTAEDGTIQEYTVTVVIAPMSSARDIVSFSFTAGDENGIGTDISGTISGTNITVMVPDNADITSLCAAFTVSKYASVSIGEAAQVSGTTVNDFSEAVVYTVTAQDGSTRDYTVTGKKPRLYSADMEAVGEFGYAVGLSGNYAIVGAYNEDGGSSNALTDSGAAYIYKNDGNGNWALNTILAPGDAESYASFGWSVSISGNYAVVEALWAGTGGVAYIFKNNGTSWTQEAILVPGDVQSGDQFGYSVSIDGNYVIIGANYESGGSGNPADYAGAAYIFKNNGSGSWTEEAVLHASDMQTYDCFGSSVSISGGYAVVGADNESGGSGDPVSSAGAAYVFERAADGSWAEKAVLHASDMQINDYFGSSVSIDGDFAVIAARAEDGGSGDPLSYAGAAYIFDRAVDGSWSENSILHASDMDTEDCFGTSVSISGDYIVIGADSESGGDGNPAFWTGAAYLFKNDGSGSWAEELRIHASDMQFQDSFGYAVCINGMNILIGARSEDGGSGDPVDGAGSAYIYRVQDLENTAVPVYVVPEV